MAANPKGSLPFSAELNAELVRLSYTQLPVALLGTVINALFVGYAFWGEVSSPRIVAWVVSIYLLSMGRYLLLLRYRKSDQNPDAAEIWARRFLWSVAFSGLTWGALSVGLFPSHSQAHQMLLGFVLGGMAGGALATLTALPRAYLLYILPAVVPFVVRILFFGDGLYVSMGMMAIIFLALMWVGSNRIHATLRESLRLRFENRQLVDDLNSAKNGLETTNRQLQDEIMERRSAEETVRQSQQRLALHVQQTPLAVIEWNTDFRVIFWNPAAEQIFGFSRAEAMGRHATELILPRNARAAVEQVWQELLTQQGGTRSTNANTTKDGRLITCEWYNTPLVDENKTVIGVASLAQDISERVKAERALKDLNDTLEQRIADALAKNREKDLILIQQSRLAAMGEMVGNIAHQWRQPLNALALVLANIKDAFQFKELDEHFLDGATRDGRRLIDQMSGTIDDFRNFFRPNREISLFNASKVVDDSVSLIQSSFDHQKIEIRYETIPEIKVEGYPNELSQVLLNLLSNAKEAIRQNGVANGWVAIKAFTRSGQCVFEVSDNGGGIPDGILQKVFDPYFTTKTTGSGIGLYMSKMILENMGGTIHVKNGPAGAVFTLVIPLTAKLPL
ncbi:MAG: sensor histidine kinase [Burkholderiales bacterium]